MIHLLEHVALGAACGWLIWRLSPPWLKGR